VIGYGTIPTGELEPGEHPWKEGKKTAYVKGDPENLIDWEQDPHKVVSLDFLKDAGFEFRV
jgi:hypothetical protein